MKYWPASIVLLALVAGASSPAEAATYRLDPGESELVVRIFKAGVAKAFAHDHVVRATEMSGTAELDPERPGSASGKITVPAASLRVDETALRERFGLDPMEDDTRREIQETMEGEGQLGIEEFPEIRFVVTEVRPLEGNECRVTGDFTLHGTTRSLTFPATVKVGDDRLHVEATLRFRQSDFGIEPYSAAFGAVQNQDEVELVVDLVLTAG